jgi:glycosyltransferase involved in cell wall biosynthesis
MKALALVEAGDHVCCRYRIRAFETTLADSGWSLAIEPLETNVFRRLMQFGRVDRFDALILQRKLLPGWQLRELRKRTKRLIFDFDDAVLYRDSYDARGPHHRRRAERFRRTVQLADVVIAGNAFLADCALKAGAKLDRVRVIPTCIDTGATTTGSGSRRPDGIDLVWIGSRSTLAGLDLQRPLWERLGREVPGLRLRMVCDHFLRFENLPVVDVPWSEATEAADVAASDIGISWIPDDLWSRGKCGLKVLQYQAAGLPVVANPVGVHPEIIRPGIDGLLPASADEWVEAVRQLAENPELRRRMGRAARSSLEARFSAAAWAPAFVEAVTGPASIHVGPTSGPIPKPRVILARDSPNVPDPFPS